MLFFSPKKNRILTAKKRGFTLVETLVSVALFSVVMVTAIGALMTIVNANQKARSLKTVMDNLGFALEDMTRSIRLGSQYFCDDNSINIVNNATQDCPAGSPAPSGPGDYFAFKSKTGSLILYKRVVVNGKGVIQKKEVALGWAPNYNDNGTGYSSITAPEIDITKLNFYVVGSGSGDTLQPYVKLVVQGTSQVGKAGTQSSFNIYTTITQRIPD